MLVEQREETPNEGGNLRKILRDGGSLGGSRSLGRGYGICPQSVVWRCLILITCVRGVMKTFDVSLILFFVTRRGVMSREREKSARNGKGSGNASSILRLRILLPRLPTTQ